MYLKNNGSSIKVPLIFWFFIIAFTLRFYHQLWFMEIVLDILHRLIHDSRNLCGCSTPDELYIELASFIIFFDKREPRQHLINTST